MLDGNEVSLFAHPAGTPELAAAERLHRSLNPRPAVYNGAIGAGQMAWLKSQLEAARLHREMVILFCHYPVFPPNHHNLWNENEVLEAVLPFQDVVAAWMNGHNHAGHYGIKNAIHFLTFKGMVDTTQSCWAEVAVHSDRLEVTGFAREPSRSLGIIPSSS